MPGCGSRAAPPRGNRSCRGPPCSSSSTSLCRTGGTAPRIPLAPPVYNRHEVSHKAVTDAAFALALCTMRYAEHKPMGTLESRCNVLTPS